MIALITTVLQIIVGATKYFFAKDAEKEQALKDLVSVYKKLDRVNERASAMRNKYKSTRDRLMKKTNDV